MHPATLLTFVLFLGTNLLAAAPTTAPSVTTLAEAKGRLLAAQTKAREQYMADLNALAKRSAQSEDRDQAKQIDEAIKESKAAQRLEYRHRTTAAPPKPIVTITVQAKDGWTRALPVKKGDTLKLVATGQWCVDVDRRETRTAGPDGIQANGVPLDIQQWALLMARIGKTYYVVGTSAEITADEDGLLELGSNDYNPTDNDGFLTVQITRLPDPH